MRLRKIVACLLAVLMLVAATPAFDLSALAAYDMPYYIEVDLTNQIVTIYSTGTDVIVRQMLCSTGVKNATPTGTYYMPPKEEKLEREEWYYFRSYSCYAHYASRIYKGVLFHSIPCSRKSDASISKTALSEFGRPASHGCVRLRWQDAEFIAKCCLEGTRVHIYRESKQMGELRELLFANSYTNEKGLSYKTYLGIPEEEGVLGRYSEGKEVVSLQTRLRDLGIYDDEIDGVYMGSTINAVREAVPLKEGMSGPVVRSAQEHLQNLKLYDGVVDGVYDVDVTQAVKRFQGAYGYPADGVLQPEIQKALYYESGKVDALFADCGGYRCDITGGRIALGRLTSDVGVRLREKPSAGSEALARLTPGDMVVVLEPAEAWNKVQHGRDVGYVNNKYLTYYPLDIYALAYTSDDGSVSYTIGYTEREYYNGASIPAAVFEDYLASDGSLDNYQGINTYAKVNTDGEGVALNLREGPNTVSAVLAELPYGTEVKVLLRSSEWSLVEWEGQNGYLLNQYLEFWETAEDESGAASVPEEDADTATLPAMVLAMDGRYAQVYDVDSDDGEPLGRLENGERVVVMETVDGWSRISYQDHIGYMKDEDLQFLLTDETVT